MPENTGLYGWDISWDGKKMLQSTKAPDQDYDANLYTITNLSDGSILVKFKYYPTGGDLTSVDLSPTSTLILVHPTYDDGIVILNLQGKVLHNLVSFQGKEIESGIWMPDETLLFTTENGLYRTDKNFAQAMLVKQINFDSWGQIAVSHDGAKIAMYASNHIWMMNADGSNLAQVTESDKIETQPVFSPDGKYLLIGTNYHQSGPFGHVFNPTIIPADGNKYNVNDGADKRVVFVKAKGETNKEFGDGNMVWR